ncbi:MAG TPA: oligopeptide transporter, OPT family [Gemmatimonadaceae bacterium]|nr:oligopeptide transporter, OPT family [Gemmatimonadaceae bacterium]
MTTSPQPKLDADADRVPLAADEALHQPYVPAGQELTELTPGAIVLGVILGLVFAASSVYLALKVGLTVSASIPIAVLSITIFRYITRAFGKQPATILQNNMVQTTGSAGESIAAGTVFTLPALLLLGYDLPWPKVAAVALVGGILGVLLMIPLRRSLIVKEHKNLKYPEGTACAEVLIVGEERGVQAKTVFMGFGLGALYKFLASGMHLWAEVPRRAFTRLLPTGGTEMFGEIRAEISPELTGVGYIIGPRIAGYLFAGGVLSWFVLIPSIKLFGAGLTQTIFPGTMLIRDMDAGEVWSKYIYYIGAGAVTTAGIISLLRALPTIGQALVAGFGDFRGVRSGNGQRRTERDLPMGIVVVGTAILAIAMVVLPQIGINIPGALLAIFFGFLFVTVSSRITGQIGSSSNPISGMTVATVLLTALIFLAVGWTGIEHRVLALSIGGVVCIAAAVAGATSQDLKTGFLVGATPARQQIGLLFGVTTSAIMIGGTIHFLNEAKTTIVPKNFPGVHMDRIDSGSTQAVRGVTYHIGRLYEQTGVAPAGKYLVDDQGNVKYLIDPGIGGREPVNYDGRVVDKLESPKSQIMALVVDGILTQKLPWGLILIGAFLAIVMEILGLPSLPIAVGIYLPISTTATMFLGGVVRWLVERKLPQEQRGGPEADSGPGVLFSSGLIAGGAIMGVTLAALSVWFVSGGTVADRISLEKAVGAFGTSGIVAVVMYVLLLSVPLYYVARRGFARE